MWHRIVAYHSPDTDVLILLMHCVASGYVDLLTQLQLVTGKGKTGKTFNVVETVCVVGPLKSKSLIGFHYFSGADWGEKFVEK